MSGMEEFVYRIPGKAMSGKPGAHRSNSRGPGLAFANYVRLIDHPDPRRLDLRASLKDVKRDWLIRATRQTSTVGIQVIADVSGSMRFGTTRSKLHIAADFLESLGYSAFRYGDALGMLAFDSTLREDLHLPGRTGRGAGNAMAQSLREQCSTSAQSIHAATTGQVITAETLLDCALHVSHGSSLVFLISDYHWPLDVLEPFLEQLSHLLVVPIVIWDPAEYTPPPQGRWLRTRDIESARQRSLWLSDKVRKRWLNQVDERRESLNKVFTAHDIKPFFMQNGFNAEALSRHFIESSL